MTEDVYVLKIEGDEEERKAMFRKAKDMLRDEFGDRISYVVLPEDVSPVDFYFKERLLSAAENMGIKAIETGIRTFVQETLKYIFSKAREEKAG